MTFDAFQQAKLQNAYQNLKEYRPAPEQDMSLDDLKTLSGTNDPRFSGECIPQIMGTDKGCIQREQNIKPGTEDWFKLWFSTGSSNWRR
jgi:hypothetical protein